MARVGWALVRWMAWSFCLARWNCRVPSWPWVGMRTTGTWVAVGPVGVVVIRVAKGCWWMKSCRTGIRVSAKGVGMYMGGALLGLWESGGWFFDSLFLSVKALTPALSRRERG